MYKISIIIPVFNVEDTLYDSFNSILNQDFGFENLEVIFIDDCSTDGSKKIIKEFSNRYDNVKSIFLDENSGFAGKPRNIGIENATSDYVMFLDPDDRFLENACSLLYENITKDNLDLVSGNFNFINRDKKTINKWNQLKLVNNIVKVKSVKEEPNLFDCNPAIWTKIYRKKLIVDNKIYFFENLPAEDLIFNAACILKANGIKFINIPIVDYAMRYDGESKSKSVSRTKNTLYGYIKAYKELYKLLIGTVYVKFAVKPLYFWTKQLILSDLLPQDKINLLRFATPLYEKFKLTDLKLNYPFKPFFEKVYEKDYVGAVSLSKKLALEFKEENHYSLIEKIKNKNIFILFHGLEEDIAGLSKVVFNRANLFFENGYSVILLNNDSLKNFKFIMDKYKNLKYINGAIDMVNMFDYYSNKNTLNFDGYKIDLTDKVKSEYHIKKIENSDDSMTLEYYKNINSNENLSMEKTFEELYINGYLTIKKVFYQGSLIKEYYFTPDHFNYFYIDYENEEFILFNRIEDYFIVFNSLQEFQDYFITEICLNSSEKPFLINDCFGPTPSMRNINSSIAYKIRVAHCYHNCVGSLENISSIDESEHEDAIVVISELTKKEFIKKLSNEFSHNLDEGIDNIYFECDDIVLNNVSSENILKKWESLFKNIYLNHLKINEFNFFEDN